MVYLHAGLEIGSAVPDAIHSESNEDSHVLGFQRFSMGPGVVTIPTGSTDGKMAKLAVLGDRPG